MVDGMYFVYMSRRQHDGRADEAMGWIDRAIVDGKLDADAFVKMFQEKIKLGLSQIVIEPHERGLKLTMVAPSEKSSFGGLGQLKDRYGLIKRLGFNVRWLVSPERMSFNVERHEVSIWNLPEGTKRTCLGGRQGCGNCDCVNTVGIADGSPLACFLVIL